MKLKVLISLFSIFISDFTLFLIFLKFLHRKKKYKLIKILFHYFLYKLLNIRNKLKQKIFSQIKWPDEHLVTILKVYVIKNCERIIKLTLKLLKITSYKKKLVKCNIYMIIIAQSEISNLFSLLLCFVF